jgi:hypothetical protein
MVNAVTILTLAVSSACISGCGAVLGPMASKSIEQAQSFTPPPGQSGVYVIRTWNIVGAAVTWEVSLDGVLLGQIPNDSYIYATVPPGTHNVSVIYQLVDTSFKTEVGKSYFFVISLSNSGSAQQLSDEEGRKYVKKMKMIR